MSIHTTVPPATDPPLILQRTDEVHTILRIFSEPTTSVVVLTGDAGAGKSMLAALVYRRLEAAAQNRVPAESTLQPTLQHFVWLSIGPNATLPDVIAAILGCMGMGTEGGASAAPTGLLKPEQQIALLMERLRHAREGVFIVLD